MPRIPDTESGEKMIHIAFRLDKATAAKMDQIAIETGITSKRGVPNRSEMVRRYVVDAVEPDKSHNKTLAELGFYKQRTAELTVALQGIREALAQPSTATKVVPEAVPAAESESAPEPAPEPAPAPSPEPEQVSVDTTPVAAKAEPRAEAQLSAVVTAAGPLPIFVDPFAATPVYPEP